MRLVLKFYVNFSIWLMVQSVGADPLEHYYSKDFSVMLGDSHLLGFFTVNVIEDERRAGDPPELVAQAHLAFKLLGWTPEYSDLETIVATALKWHKKERYVAIDESSIESKTQS
jgi:hypothetical protein